MAKIRREEGKDGGILQEGRDRWERGRTWELLNAPEEIERAALTCHLLGPTDSLG